MTEIVGVLCIIDAVNYICSGFLWGTRAVLGGYMPSTVISVDAVSRCSPHCAFKLNREGVCAIRQKA